MNAEKKVAVVTGASRGIGRAIAMELASEGAFVIIMVQKKRQKRLKPVSKSKVDRQKSASAMWQILMPVAPLSKIL